MIKLKHTPIVVGFMAFFSLFILSTAQTHAATFSVAAGNDENTDNGSCSLSEAIQNISDQAVTNSDCPAGDGSNDIITLPSGTITLTADLPHISESVIIEGQGMGQTIIDGDTGQWTPFRHEPSDSLSLLTIRDLTITAFQNFGIYSNAGNLAIQRIEADCTDAVYATGPSSAGGAIGMGNNNSGADVSFTATDVYVHSCDNNDMNVLFGIGLITAPGGTDTGDLIAELRNITVEDISGTNTVAGLFVSAGFQGGNTGDIDFTAENVTLSELNSSSGNGVGLVNMTLSQNTESLSSLVRLNNATIGNTTGSTGLIGSGGAGIATIAAAGAPGLISTAQTIITNSVLFNNDANCLVSDITSAIGGSGDGSVSKTSEGGNISDDASCLPYFAESTDQNNIGNLSSTLSPLANNGGHIPTIALLESSPAVDSGVTIAGLTTDARGETRPQGLAYDSGAYESPFTRPAAASPNQDSLADTGTSPMPYLLTALSAILVSIFVIQKRSSNV